MTEQHPLTAEICFDIQRTNKVCYQDEVNLMRAAADWQVEGSVCGNVNGDVVGNVEGDVHGNVGNVWRTINGREWQFVETPKEKLKRLLYEGAYKDQLLEEFNQLEDN